MIRLTTLVAALVVFAFAPVASAQEKGKGDAAKGKELFETKCGLCHNTDSKEKKIGPGLQGVKDGKLPSGKDTTYKNLLDNLNAGGGGMPAFEKRISQEEKDNVIAYVMTL
jgi:mono/diheme cytochrome c family protein